jgi:hypothetical protein
MNKLIGLYLMLLFLCCFRAEAQQVNLSVLDEQKRQLLGMTVERYTAFSQGVQELNKHYREVFQNKSMTKEQKRVTLDQLQDQKKAHIDQYLSEEQRKKLFEWEKSRNEAHGSPYQKHKRMVEERLKKRGMRFTTAAH